jgi:hypothetical protein
LIAFDEDENEHQMALEENDARNNPYPNLGNNK